MEAMISGSTEQPVVGDTKEVLEAPKGADVEDDAEEGEILSDEVSDEDDPGTNQNSSSADANSTASSKHTSAESRSKGDRTGRDGDKKKSSSRGKDSNVKSTSSTNNSNNRSKRNRDKSDNEQSDADQENRNRSPRKRNRKDSSSSTDSDDGDKQRLLMQLMQQMAQMLSHKGNKKLDNRKTVEMVEKLTKNDNNVDPKDVKELVRKNRRLLRSPSRDRRGRSRSPSRDRRTRDRRKDRRSRSRSRDRSDKSANDGLPLGPQTKERCKYFAEGKCLKGHECPFSHEVIIPKKREICKFYLQGYCGKGDHCNYMHGEFPCKFFHTGVECYAGPKCRFSHQPLTEEGREILRGYLDSGELPDDHLRRNEQTQQEQQGDQNFQQNVQIGMATSTYQPMKPVPKRHAVLGDVTDAMRTSYYTWTWQQEMKELELAYVGTKRNLFCIESQFAMREKPPTPTPEDEDPDEVECKIMSYYIDTMGSLPGAPQVDPNAAAADIDIRQISEAAFEDPYEEPEEMVEETKPAVASNPFGVDFGDDDPFLRMSAHDEDLRVPPVNQQPLKSEPFPSQDNALQSQRLWSSDSERNYQNVDNVFKNPGDFESEDSKPKPKYDIVKMLNVIRQSSSSTGSSSPGQTTTATDQKTSEFWQNILSGTSLGGTSPSNVLQAKDPRLKKNVEVRQDSDGNKCSPDINASPRSITTKETSSGSTTAEWKLYSMTIPSINYTPYTYQFHNDPKLKNDPRLQNFFTKKLGEKTSATFSSSSSIFTTNRSLDSKLSSMDAFELPSKPSDQQSIKNPLSPTLPLPPLTLTTPKTSFSKTIIPPPPPPIMSPFELMSSTVKTASLSSVKEEAKSTKLPISLASGMDLTFKKTVEASNGKNENDEKLEKEESILTDESESSRDESLCINVSPDEDTSGNPSNEEDRNESSHESSLKQVFGSIDPTASPFC